MTLIFFRNPLLMLSSRSLIQFTLTTPMAFLFLFTYSMTSGFDLTANAVEGKCGLLEKVEMYRALAELGLSKIIRILFKDDLGLICFQVVSIPPIISISWAGLKLVSGFS